MVGTLAHRSPTEAYGPVPVMRLWSADETCVCIGSGPSLTPEDVAYCDGRARVLAIKHVVTLAPWADVLYGAGADWSHGQTWWTAHGPTLSFDGLRYCLDPRAARWASVLEHGPAMGWSDDPSRLALGGHSGYSAINLAWHLGARRIVLLGYDMQATGGRQHYFGDHTHGAPGRKLPFAWFDHHWPAIVPELTARGITVLNASRQSALTLFPHVSLQEALS